MFVGLTGKRAFAPALGAASLTPGMMRGSESNGMASFELRFRMLFTRG